MRAELTKVGDNVLDLAFIDEDKLNGEKLLELLAKSEYLPKGSSALTSC